ncbi:MAG: hypothetical protein HC811_12180, partial [Flammeovirgaceae bacterium]|nr:hypothetical protein [Flammeovirgaceae bacterium]
MKKLISLSFLCFLCVSVVLAQDDAAFVVMGTKGPNQVKSGESWEPIKAFSKLNASDAVKVSDNSYLGLSHSSGRVIELTKSGEYNVADLAGKITGSSSVLNKYTEFILSKNSADGKANRLAATGAVHRGINDIKLFIPTDSKMAEVYNQNLQIGWEAASSGGTYIVTLKDVFDDVVFRKETSDQHIEVNINEGKMAKEPQLFIEVISKEDHKKKSEKLLIKKIPPADRGPLDQKIQEINLDLTEDT